jgi:hypothetical protein
MGCPSDLATRRNLHPALSPAGGELVRGIHDGCLGTSPGLVSPGPLPSPDFLALVDVAQGVCA